MAVTLNPLRLAQVVTSAKGFDDRAGLGHQRLNAWGLHEARVRLACAVSRRRRAHLAATLDAEDRRNFDRDGFVIRPDFLPNELFGALREQVRTLRTSVREKHEGSTLLRKVPVDEQVSAALPALRELLHNDTFRALLAYGEGRRAPPAIYLQTVVQNDQKGRPDPQCSLHRDTFHPTVKAWLYLSDVPEQAGPLVYVPGSHRLTPERLRWERDKCLKATSATARPDGAFRVSARELAALGHPPPRALAVAANTLIVADTFGFHARGVSRGRSTRMEVWAIGRRAPFLPLWLDRALTLAMRPQHSWQVREQATAYDTD